MAKYGKIYCEYSKLRELSVLLARDSDQPQKPKGPYHQNINEATVASTATKLQE